MPAQWFNLRGEFEARLAHPRKALGAPKFTLDLLARILANPFFLVSHWSLAFPLPVYSLPSCPDLQLLVFVTPILASPLWKWVKE